MRAIWKLYIGKLYKNLWNKDCRDISGWFDTKNVKFSQISRKQLNWREIFRSKLIFWPIFSTNNAIPSLIFA